jgi:glycosyltransferase involved in cell wall biosynthesis
MNILFVLYGDFSVNSANLLALYAREFLMCGHHCAVAVPCNVETVQHVPNIYFRPLLYEDVLNNPEVVFSDGRPADVIHAWTPRENVRRFVTSYMMKRPTPLVVYLEDNELWIACRALSLNKVTLARQTEQSISERLPDALSHPFFYSSFIGLADAVAVIQDKLEIDVPPWIYRETVLPGVDLEFFSPRKANHQLRKRYSIAENEKIIVYPGGLNGFTQAAIETLCRAVGLINQQGWPCKLLRTGPFALNFIDQMPLDVAASINDLGVLPRNELPELLALADVFVQPGKIDPFEDLRLPGKLPELLAMGRPVVMPDVNIAHLFKDGLDAVLTRTGTAEEIATKCISLFSDPQQADRIGQSGRRFAEKYFDVKSQSRQMMHVYEVACDNFDSMTAAEVWRIEDKNTPGAILLARKLKLLADQHSTKLNLNAGEILKEYARYIELMELRVKGLEAGIVEIHKAMADREVQIADLCESTSRKITLPLRMVAQPVAQAIKRGGGVKGTLKKAMQLYLREGLAGIKRGLKIVTTSKYGRNNYTEWIRCYDMLTDESRFVIRDRIDNFLRKPLISIVMPVYNTKPEWLMEAIESIRKQIYPCWELCIADDASKDKRIRPILESYAIKDKRIKVIFREINGNISVASNSALAQVTGEWVALLDHDDLLAEQALFWVADAINKNQDACLIYSDEDKIDASGKRFDPYFKCDWNIDLFYSHNMITHLGIYRTRLLKEIGGFRKGLEGAQDYDLALRCVERIEPKQIHHIPRVLYHWRAHGKSTAQDANAKPYAMLAGEKALNEHFQRQRINARAELINYGYRVRYALPDKLPLVSLIIPARNGLQLIQNCVESILKKTTYPNYEILIVDNGSDDPATRRYFKQLQSDPKIRVVRDNRPFNFSALNNAAAKLARGEVLGLLNNDLEVISPEWLSEMVGIALQPKTGAVGARLWYSNKSLQHGGIILGIGGWAGHAHKGFHKGHPGYVGRMSLISGFSAVTGACLIVRRQLYEQLGGLNESHLQTACNDVDFCLRLREAGYRNIWTPYAELYHYESATRGYENTPEKQKRFEKEVAYMKQHWGDILQRDPAYSPNLTLDHEDFSLAWPPRVN